MSGKDFLEPLMEVNQVQTPASATTSGYLEVTPGQGWE